MVKSAVGFPLQEKMGLRHRFGYDKAAVEDNMSYLWLVQPYIVTSCVTFME